MQPKVKVLIRSLSVDGEKGAESVWADKLDADTYRVQNIPFLAYNVSLHDVVRAPIDQGLGMPVFEKVLAKSGNRTFRLYLRWSIWLHWIAKRKLRQIVDLGCDYVFANRKYVAVNVPAEVEVAALEAVLETLHCRW